jgi:stage V sporulation protein G
MNDITEIQIIPIKPRDGLVGFASLVFDGIYLGSIGIYKKLNGDGFRLLYPTRKIGEKNINVFHPINRETSEQIEKEVLEKAEKLFSL